MGNTTFRYSLNPYSLYLAIGMLAPGLMLLLFVLLFMYFHEKIDDRKGYCVYVCFIYFMLGAIASHQYSFSHDGAYNYVLYASALAYTLIYGVVSIGFILQDTALSHVFFQMFSLGFLLPSIYIFGDLMYVSKSRWK